MGHVHGQRGALDVSVERMLPAMQIAIAVGASAIYFMTGDWRRGLYWAAASVITFAVTA
jgi:hypothetical protein